MADVIIYSHWRFAALRSDRLLYKLAVKSELIFTIEAMVICFE